MSSLNDFLTDLDLKQADIGAEHLGTARIMLCLLETGNTIDGVVIAKKLLQKFEEEHSVTPMHGKEEDDPRVYLHEISLNLNKLFDWKQRRCHHCLEFIFETGNAIMCSNSIWPIKACSKIYCFSCVVGIEA